MSRGAFLVLGLAIMAAAGGHSPAVARDGCGEGWFYNGSGCARMEGPHRYYNDGPVYAPQRYYYNRGYSMNAVRPVIGANGTISCGNPNYTWQDGACRPYRGR